MKTGYRLGAILAAALTASAGPAMMANAAKAGEAGFGRLSRRALGFTPAQFRQPKGKAAKRKLRANRLHISKRVRRKHRRAAR